MNIFSARQAPHNNCSRHFEDPACLSTIAGAIFSNIQEMNPRLDREIIYLCIGTDRATGDCVGPLVGTRLQALGFGQNVFGTLEKPTHAANLARVLGLVEERYFRPLIVAVDASLGNSDRIGFINVKKGGLKPGTALKKTLPEVGDFHISAVVNVGGFLEQMVLQNTRLYLVHQMADLIARSLYIAHLCYNGEAKNKWLPGEG